jgi:hypothetical protein
MSKYSEELKSKVIRLLNFEVVLQFYLTRTTIRTIPFRSCYIDTIKEKEGVKYQIVF